MVDAEQETTVAAKSILKRRVVGNGTPVMVVETCPAAGDDGCGCGDHGKRYVTFDETITVKNDRNMVVTKPLKLELVIENWKSRNAKTAPEIVLPDSGIVRRLVDEYNEPLIDNAEFEFSPPKDDNDKDNISMADQTDIPLCKALETVNLTQTANIE